MSITKICGILFLSVLHKYKDPMLQNLLDIISNLYKLSVILHNLKKKEGTLKCVYIMYIFSNKTGKNHKQIMLYRLIQITFCEFKN